MIEIKSEKLKLELDILRKNLEFVDDTLILDDYIEPLNKIYEIFQSQGHSGGSTPYYSASIQNAIKVMLEHDIMSPITGSDEEWKLVSYDGCKTIAFTDNAEQEGKEIQKLVDEGKYEPVYQNKRLFSIFKNEKTGRITYLDAIVWREDDYISFTGTVEGISSRQNITLPFTPKTFYIDIIRDYHDLNWFIENNIDYDVDETGEEYRYYRYIIKDKRQLREVRKLYKFKAEF